MNPLLPEQLTVLRENTRIAIHTGLAARYLQVLRNTPTSLGGNGDIRTLEYLEELAEQRRRASTAELDIAYHRFTSSKYSAFFIVLFDSVRVSTVAQSKTPLAYVNHTNPTALIPDDARDAAFTFEDCEMLLERYTAQKAVGLHKIIDTDITKWISETKDE